MTTPMSPEQAAAYLGICQRTFMDLARAGKIKGGRLGSGKGKGAPWFFLKQHLDEYLLQAVEENHQQLMGTTGATKKPRRRPCPPPPLTMANAKYPR